MDYHFLIIGFVFVFYCLSFNFPYGVEGIGALVSRIDDSVIFSPMDFKPFHLCISFPFYFRQVVSSTLGSRQRVWGYF